MTPSAVSKLISRLEKDWVSGYSIVQHVSFSLPVKDASFMSKAFKYSMTWTNWNNRLPQIIYRKGELESIPVFILDTLLLPCISLFNQRYPEIELEAHLSDEVINLVEQRIDVAIRTGPLKAPIWWPARLAVLINSMFALLYILKSTVVLSIQMNYMNISF